MNKIDPVDEYKKEKNHTVINMSADSDISKEINGLSDCILTQSVLALKDQPTLIETKLQQTLQLYRQLTVINLDDNQIMELPEEVFWPCEMLNDLSLANNQIKKLPEKLFTRCKCLKSLSFKQNNVKKLYNNIFKGLDQLLRIDASHNQITELNRNHFKNCKLIEDIDLSDNHLVDVESKTFDSCERVLRIDLKINKLTKLSEGLFKNCCKLTKLDINSNLLTFLPANLIKDCTMLESLNVSKNQIKQLDTDFFKNCQFMIDIKFSDNQIETLPEDLLTGCPNLKQIAFANNNLAELSPDFFSTNTKLTHIFAQANSLETLPGKIFSKCPHLVLIDLGLNKLTDIPSELFSKSHELIDLTLSSNRIRTFSARTLEACKALEIIRLDKNKLTEVSETTFWKCTELNEIYLNKNRIQQLPANLFMNLPKLKFIQCGTNQLRHLPPNLLHPVRKSIKTVIFRNMKISAVDCAFFKDCNKLEEIFLNNNQLKVLPWGLFKDCTELRRIFLGENEICCVDATLLETCTQLTELHLSCNFIRQIPEKLLENCQQLNEVYFNNNDLTSIPSNLFKQSKSLREIYFNNNQIKDLDATLFQNCMNLSEIDLSNNQIETLDVNLFKGCIKLEDICLAQNQIKSLSPDLFRDCHSLKELFMSRNCITELDQNLFRNCCRLNDIDFSHNRIEILDEHLFTSCKQLENIDFSNNCLSAIFTTSIKELLMLRSIDFTNNVDYNSSDIFENYFVKARPRSYDDYYKTNQYGNILLNWMDVNEKCLFRNGDTSRFIRDIFQFFLNQKMTTWDTLFGKKPIDDPEINELCFEANIDLFENYDMLLLDIFISTLRFSEIRLINFKKFIDTKLRNDAKLINIEFQMKSPHSIEMLCLRNSIGLFKAFFIHNYFDLIDVVKTIPIKSKRYDQNELEFFVDFENYIHKPEFVSNAESSKFFAIIDYCKCFRHALANKNQEVACFLLVMLRYLYLKHPDDYEKKCALKEFNKAFMAEFLPKILELGLFDIVNLILDIKKIDVLIRNRSLHDKKYAKKKGNLNKKDFISYEIEFKHGEPSSKQFLENISNFDELLVHESTQYILAHKWNEQAKFLYWSKLILYLIFIICFTIHIEVHNKPLKANFDSRQAVKYISLALSCVFLAFEMIRLVIKLVKRRLINYIFSQNLIETLFYSLVISCLVIEYGEAQSSLLSVTILIAYVIFLMKLDKVEPIGAFVTAFYSIIKGSFTLLWVVFILLLGFLLSFRNRADTITQNEVELTFAPMTKFNTTFEVSLFKILVMLVGGVDTDDMGLDEISWKSLVNYLIYAIFIYIITILSFNFFTGLVIGEVATVVRDSAVITMKAKIQYIYDGDYKFLMRRFSFKKKITLFSPLVFIESFFKKLRLEKVYDYIEETIDNFQESQVGVEIKEESAGDGGMAALEQNIGFMLDEKFEDNHEVIQVMIEKRVDQLLVSGENTKINDVNNSSSSETKATKRDKSSGDLMAKVSRIEEKIEKMSQLEKSMTDEIARIKQIETKLDKLLQNMIVQK